MIDPVSLTIIGLMTVSPRIRRWGARAGFLLTLIGFICLIVGLAPFALLGVLGIVLLFYWLVAGFIRWLMGIVAEDIDGPRRGGEPDRPNERASRESSRQEPRFEDEELPQQSTDELESRRPWHEVLGVKPSATYEEAYAAFRRRSKEYHPDRVSGLGEKLREMAEQEMKAINAAFEEAKNRSRRSTA